MATKAGPVMKRVKLADGSTILLPADAVLQPVWKPGDSVDMTRQLSGTY